MIRVVVNKYLDTNFKLVHFVQVRETIIKNETENIVNWKLSILAPTPTTTS